MNEEGIKLVRAIEKRDQEKYGPIQKCCNMYLYSCRCGDKEVKKEEFKKWKATQEA